MLIDGSIYTRCRWIRRQISIQQSIRWPTVVDAVFVYCCMSVCLETVSRNGVENLSAKKKKTNDENICLRFILNCVFFSAALLCVYWSFFVLFLFWLSSAFSLAIFLLFSAFKRCLLFIPLHSTTTYNFHLMRTKTVHRIFFIVKIIAFDRFLNSSVSARFNRLLR